MVLIQKFSDQCGLLKVLITNQIYIFHEGSMDRIFYYVQKELYTKNGTFIHPVTIREKSDIKPLH